MEHLAIDTDILAVVKVLPVPAFSEVILRYLSPLYHSALPYTRVLKHKEYFLGKY